MNEPECSNCKSVEDVKGWRFPGFENIVIPICRACYGKISSNFPTKAEKLLKFDDLVDYQDPKS